MKLYSAIGVMLIIGSCSIQPLYAQKKKKGTPPVAQGMRQREAEFYFTEGEKYFILEDYAKALLYYQKSLEASPENATIHYKIAEVLSRSNKHEDLVKASISIENALRIEKDNKYFYLLAANIYNGLSRFDKAALVYESLLQDVEGSEEYLYDLAAEYQYDNKPDEAIKAYSRAEGVFGVNEVSSLQKIRLYMEAGKNKEALDESVRLIAAFPDEERYAMGIAEILSQKGQQREAISILEKFVKDNQSAGNARMLLAGFYRDVHEEEKARTLLQQVFDDPSVEFGSKVIILGTYNTELNQDKVKGLPLNSDKEAFALMLYKKLIKAYPQESGAHLIGGDLYLTAGKNREAVEEYLESIKLGEQSFEVWQNLLYLEIRQNQFDNTIKHSDEALEIFPNQSMIWYFNGYAHLRKHHYDEATAALEQARKLMNENNTGMRGEICSMLGEAYNAMKQYEKSDKAYDDALAINPNNDVVLNNYSYYLALRKDNLEKAEKMSEKLTKDNPDNATYLDTYAWVLYARQKYKEARKVMERAISSGQASATYFEHYGDILFKLGDVNGAVQQWEKARGTDANNEQLNKKIANRKIYE